MAEPLLTETFGLGGYRIRYLTDEPLALAYARDMFVPVAVTVTDGSPDAGYRIVDRTVSRDDLLSRVGAGPSSTCRPTRSTRMRVNRSRGEVWYVDDGDSVDHVVTRGPGVVSIGAAPGPERIRFGVRYLREVWYRLLGAAGYVTFHASSVRLPGGGTVMIVGDSGAGKTTLALALAVHASATLVANERTLVRPGPDGFEVVGLPSAVRVDPVTMGLFGWQSWSDANCWRPGVHRGGKQERLPGELRRYAGVAASGGGELAAVLLPSRARPGRSPLGDPRQLLGRNCYTPVDPIWPEDWLGIGGPQRSPADVDAVIDRLLSDVPTIVCGTGDEPLPELARQVVEAVGTAHRVTRPAGG